MLLPRDPVWRWFLGTLISVPACLAVWWFYLRDPLLTGLAWAVGAAAPLLWPETVLDLKMQGGQAWLISLVPTLTDPPRLFTPLPLPLNRAVAVFPLFWGFTLATPGRGLARRLLLGTVILLPVAFLMAVLTTQFHFSLFRTHVPALTLMPPSHFGMVLPDSPTAFYLWGVGRQLSVLVLPIVAPLLVWLGLHGDFIRNLLFARLTRRSVDVATPPAVAAVTPPASSAVDVMGQEAEGQDASPDDNLEGSSSDDAVKEDSPSESATQQDSQGEDSETESARQEDSEAETAGRGISRSENVRSEISGTGHAGEKYSLMGPSSKEGYPL